MITLTVYQPVRLLQKNIEDHECIKNYPTFALWKQQQ